jgi:hypothetical protein
MNAIILKGAALRQPPLPQSGLRAKTFAHPCCRPCCVVSYFVQYPAVGYLQLAESKLRALSVSVSLKQPDKRFEAIKNYGNELQVHMMGWRESQIEKVQHKSCFCLKFLTKKHHNALLYFRYYLTYRFMLKIRHLESISASVLDRS